jgi:hypothetical protein
MGLDSDMDAGYSAPLAIDTGGKYVFNPAWAGLWPLTASEFLRAGRWARAKERSLRP